MHFDTFFTLVLNKEPWIGSDSMNNTYEPEITCIFATENEKRQLGFS